MPQQPLKLLRASAGSGKTFSLTLHYLTLLFSSAGKYKEILAVTFTNKATAEMKERILGALEDIAKGEKSDFKPLLRQNYPELSDEALQRKAQDIYSSILHDYGRFSVSTIDGFVQKVIRSFAFELNLDSGYKLEMNQDKVKDELVKALNLQLENDPELLEWVTSLALERISDGKDWNYQRALKDLANEIFKERYYPFQEAMLLMGDERSDEFNKLKYRVSTGIKEFNKIMADKASDLKYLLELSGVEAEDLAKKSMNPLFKFDKILKEDYSGIDGLANLVDDPEVWPNKASKNMDAVNRLYEEMNPLLKDLVLYYLNGSEQYETWLAIHKNISYLRLMQEMASLLKEYRSENKALLISDAQQLLTGITGADADNPSFIWEKTGARYKHFLFDEFQDTSTMQWVNFLPLIKNALAEFEGRNCEHLIVGDVKQSIYRWRSGDWRILHSYVKRDVMIHNIAEERLEFNRRSAENIIRFNNFLYALLPTLLQQQINQILRDDAKPEFQRYWEEEYHQIIEKAYEDNQQSVTPQTAKGGKIEIRFISKDDAAEANEENDSPIAATHIFHKLVELMAVHRFAMKDICILVKTNKEAENIIECLLQRQDVLSTAAEKTFQVISGDALKIDSNLAVQLLINVFRMLAVRNEEQPIFRATCIRLYNQINHPQGEEGLVDLGAADWMKISNTSISGLTDYFPQEFCLNFNNYRQLPMTELVEKMILLFGLGAQRNGNHIPFLLALRDQVALFASGGDQGLNAFLYWWDEEGCKKALPSSDQQDAVQIMTIHKSKGLEFKAVLIPFLNWKLNTPSGFLKKLLWVNAGDTEFSNFSKLPVDYSAKLAGTAFAREYFEEMLLNYMDTLNTLYVATTRARDYLYLVCPKTTLESTGKKKEGPKNELQNILLDLLKQQGAPDYTLEEQLVSYGSFPERPVGKDKPHNGLEISEYEVNDQLSARFNYQVSVEDNWHNARQRKGIVLHKILETLTDLNDLDKLIAFHLQEGLIRHGEKEEIKHAVSDVLKQTEIAEWFKSAKTIISERDMILEGGAVRRPDKLFVMEDRAVLLDFKFGAAHSKYLDDISLYRDNLMKMDAFKQVDAYIWYAETQKLLKV